MHRKKSEYSPTELDRYTLMFGLAIFGTHTQTLRPLSKSVWVKDQNYQRYEENVTTIHAARKFHCIRCLNQYNANVLIFPITPYLRQLIKHIWFNVSPKTCVRFFLVRKWHFGFCIVRKFIIVWFHWNRKKKYNSSVLEAT